MLILSMWPDRCQYHCQAAAVMMWHILQGQELVAFFDEQDMSAT
jgi:hypothetical protein